MNTIDMQLVELTETEMQTIDGGAIPILAAVGIAVVGTAVLTFAVVGAVCLVSHNH